MAAETFPTTFRAFLIDNLGDQDDEPGYLEDIANYGAHAGFPHLTYTRDCVDLHDRYESELWAMLRSDADDFGYDNVAAFLASLSRSDWNMLDDLDGTKTLIVWYAAERIAWEIVNA